MDDDDDVDFLKKSFDFLGHGDLFQDFSNGTLCLHENTPVPDGLLDSPKQNASFTLASKHRPHVLLDKPTIPTVLVPSVTSQVQMRSDEDTKMFLLANDRNVKRPAHANTARLSVLNALRTIVPSRGVFKAGHICVDLVIYDFYYRGTELRMIIMLLDTQEVFDAFAFQEDILHVMASCSDIMRGSDNMKWSDWIKKEPGFELFYIKCQQVNRYQSLHRSICSAAKTLKYNDSLVNWITGSTRSFFTSANVKNVPISWKPLPDNIAPLLYCAPHLQALNADGLCLYKARTGSNCTCDEIKSDYNRELKLGTTTGFWEFTRMLPYIPSLLGWQVRLVMQPCMADIRSIQISKLAAEKEKKIYETLKAEHGKRKVRPAYDIRGCRLLCTQNGCTELASCYWTRCCAVDHPIACREHVLNLLGSSDLMDMVECPVHKISGRVADLL
jgi:hypothetical protein